MKINFQGLIVIAILMVSSLVRAETIIHSCSSPTTKTQYQVVELDNGSVRLRRKTDDGAISFVSTRCNGESLVASDPGTGEIRYDNDCTKGRNIKPVFEFYPHDSFSGGSGGVVYGWGFFDDDVKALIFQDAVVCTK